VRSALLSIGAGCLLVALGCAYWAAKRKNVFIWIGGYLLQNVRRALIRGGGDRPIHILFCFVDHFEPISPEQMEAWQTRYPRLAARHWDSDGVPPQHTWFYPGEQYQPEYLDALSDLARQGLGEIELHLHHGYDTAESLRARLEQALRQYERHGALVVGGAAPTSAYAFIHGNLALDNSMGDPRLCGVNNELEILQATGCYADFSMPTAPSRSQTRKINSLYYAIDDPAAPKSHDTGVDITVGGRQREGLLVIQGPLALDWRHRKFGLLPGIDNAEIMGSYPATPARIRRWVRQHIHVRGRPEWVVVKVSCHGAEPRNFDALLGKAANRLYTYLERTFRDRAGYRLHYVTARELYNIVKAAEGGAEGDPGEFRDALIAPYLNRPAAADDSRKIHAK